MLIRGLSFISRKDVLDRLMCADNTHTHTHTDTHTDTHTHTQKHKVKSWTGGWRLVCLLMSTAFILFLCVCVCLSIHTFILLLQTHTLSHTLSHTHILSHTHSNRTGKVREEELIHPDSSGFPEVQYVCSVCVCVCVCVCVEVV